jgi:hypothetical protein
MVVDNKEDGVDAKRGRLMDNKHEEEEANNVAIHHELLRNRMATQNNVVNKRKVSILRSFGEGGKK